MSVLCWNMTQVCYLIHCAKSTSNAETIVNFSPSLTNMSKHGNCTARERKNNEWKEGRMTDEQMHEQPEITGIYLLTDREIGRIEGKDKDGGGEKKSEGRKDAWDRLMSDRQTDR